MSDTIRSRLAQIALKVEATQGVDSIVTTPVAGDYVTCNFSVRFSQDQSPNQTETGAYEDLPPIPGGLRAEITATIQMAGSGAAATPPEWGKLMRACRMLETITAAAVGAPTAAAAGTGTTVTAAAPFVATAQIYRGMPLLISGTPPAATDVILDYTVGRVITLSRSYSPALTTSALLQVPPNVLYSPISDEASEASLTAYVFKDGLRHRFTGLKGSWGVGLRAGQPASLAFRFTGLVAGYKEAIALPAGYVPVTRQPPRCANSVAQINRATSRFAAASWDMGVRTAYPENPEAAEGYDPPIITGAGPRITMDPFQSLVNTPLRGSAFRAGTAVPVAAIWGSVAGNRFALSCPSAQIVDLQESERAELDVDQIALQPDQNNASMFLSCF